MDIFGVLSQTKSISFILFNDSRISSPLTADSHVTLRHFDAIVQEITLHMSEALFIGQVFMQEYTG